MKSAGHKKVRKSDGYHYPVSICTTAHTGTDIDLIDLGV